MSAEPAASEAVHLIDQPHVCLTVPLGAIWYPPLIFTMSLPIHLIFLLCQYSPLCPTIHCLPLRPPPPNLAFCASASLLFHSLPINLVCLGLWEEVREGGEEGHGQKGWTVKWKRGAALGMRWRMGMNKGQVNCKKTSQSGALLTMGTFTLAV